MVNEPVLLVLCGAVVFFGLTGIALLDARRKRASNAGKAFGLRLMTLFQIAIITFAAVVFVQIALHAK
jgi:hypothetical protein